MRPPLLALLALAALLLPRTAAAQQFDITFPDPIQFATATAADFLVGYVDHPGATIVVQPSNPGRRWTLELRADAANLGGSWGKPLNQLLWRVAGSTTWQPVTASYVTVAAAQRGTQTIVLQFRTLLSWNADEPATYGAPLSLRASF